MTIYDVGIIGDKNYNNHVYMLYISVTLEYLQINISLQLLQFHV